MPSSGPIESCVLAQLIEAGPCIPFSFFFLVALLDCFIMIVIDSVVGVVIIMWGCRLWRFLFAKKRTNRSSLINDDNDDDFFISFLLLLLLLLLLYSVIYYTFF